MLRIPFYKAQLCDSGLSYEFVPTKTLKLPLAKIGKELQSQPVFMEISTSFIITLKMEDVKMSLYPSGKVLVKHVSSKSEAERRFKRLIGALNKCPSLANL